MQAPKGPIKWKQILNWMWNGKVRRIKCKVPGIYMKKQRWIMVFFLALWSVRWKFIWEPMKLFGFFFFLYMQSSWWSALCTALCMFVWHYMLPVYSVFAIAQRFTLQSPIQATLPVPHQNEVDLSEHLRSAS